MYIAHEIHMCWILNLWSFWDKKILSKPIGMWKSYKSCNSSNYSRFFSLLMHVFEYSLSFNFPKCSLKFSYSFPIIYVYLNFKIYQKCCVFANFLKIRWAYKKKFSPFLVNFLCCPDYHMCANEWYVYQNHL
jgi:hypothetical protein